jgi:hypothetical protein
MRRYAIGTARGGIFVSDDLQNWERVVGNEDPNEWVYRVKANPHGWVAAGSYGPGNNSFILTSPDGDAWDLHTLNNGSTSFQDLATDGQYWLAPTLDGPYAWMGGPDGWVPVNVGIHEQRAALRAEGLWLVGGRAPFDNLGALRYSEDGQSWEYADISLPAGGHVYALGYGNGVFVAFYGALGLAVRSTDGMAWQQATVTQASEPVLAVEWNGAYFVAVGHGLSLVSADGAVWESYDAPSLRDVIWAGDRWVAVGDGVYHSFDGVTWSPAPSPAVGWEAMTAVGRAHLAPRPPRDPRMSGHPSGQRITYS